MSSQPGKRTIPIQVLPNISRSKGNQTINFDKFIEYHMKTSSLKNDAQNVLQKHP